MTRRQWGGPATGRRSIGTLSAYRSPVRNQETNLWPSSRVAAISSPLGEPSGGGTLSPVTIRPCSLLIRVDRVTGMSSAGADEHNAQCDHDRLLELKARFEEYRGAMDARLEKLNELRGQ